MVRFLRAVLRFTGTSQLVVPSSLLQSSKKTRVSLGAVRKRVGRFGCNLFIDCC